MASTNSNTNVNVPRRVVYDEENLPNVGDRVRVRENNHRDGDYDSEFIDDTGVGRVTRVFLPGESDHW